MNCNSCYQKLGLINFLALVMGDGVLAWLERCVIVRVFVSSTLSRAPHPGNSIFGELAQGTVSVLHGLINEVHVLVANVILSQNICTD